MKNNTNKAMVIATLTMSVMMIAGAVIASHLGVAATTIAVGIALALCLGTAVMTPMFIAASKKNRDK